MKVFFDRTGLVTRPTDSFSEKGLTQHIISPGILACTVKVANHAHCIRKFAEVSGDGLELYITSHRSGSIGECDIWVARRDTRSEPFGVPTHLGSNVNTSAPDGAPQLWFDGLTLIFERGPGPNGSDIWMARRKSTSEPFAPAVKLPGHVNSPYGEWGGPSLSSDGSTLYFSSNRHGDHTEFDIWQARALPIVDFNGDEIVDLADFAKLTQYWCQNQSSVDIAPPPFGDGMVDYEDLAVLGQYWLEEVLAPSLVAYWKLDETEGFIAHDSAGDNDGTLHGDPVWQPTSGIVNGALELDGIDDFVSTPFSLSPAAAPFSAFVWARGGSPGQVVISQSGGMDWLLADAEGKLMTMLRRSSFSPTLASGYVITDGDWHHIGVVWDGSHRHLYADGTEVAEDTADVGYLRASNGTLYIGAGSNSEPGSFFSGLIDDVRIHSAALRTGSTTGQ